jgi:hypothetical protein
MQFILGEGNMVFSLISRNVAGQTKKSLTLTITFIAWAAGNMIGPQIFQANDSPRYHKAWIAHLCLYGTFNVVLFVTRIIIMKRNREKRAAALEGEDAPLFAADDNITHAFAFDDLTDLENPNFRYVF